MAAGEDEDVQEVFQSHVIDMDTSARSKADLVRMVLYVSVDTLTYMSATVGLLWPRKHISICMFIVCTLQRSCTN